MTTRPLHQQYIIYKGSSGGGGGEDPDPATYCPANGYVDPESIDPALFCPPRGYLPDDPIVEPPDDPIVPVSSGEYVFLVDNTMNARPGIMCNGTYTIKLTELDGTVLQSYDRTSSYNQYFDLPQGEYKQWLIRVTERDAAGIKSINRATSNPGSQPILWAWLNCSPNLTSLSSFMNGVISFKGLSLDGDVSSLNSFSSAFKESGIEEFIFPQIMPAMTTFYEMFRGSAIKRVVAENISAPISSLQYMFADTYNIKKIEITINDTLISDNAYILHYFAQYSSAEEIILNFSITKGAYDIELSYACSYTSRLKSVTFPYLEGGTKVTDSISYCPKLEIAIFRGGTVNLIVGSTGWFMRSTPSLKRLEFNFVSLTINTSIIDTSLTKNYILEEIVCPTDYFNYSFTSTYLPNIKKIEGTFSNDGTQQLAIVINHPLQIINVPNYKLSRLVLGSNTVRLAVQEVILDFANSPFTNTGTNQIHCDISATEINRIFSLLPSIARTIDVRNSTGASGCDPSIAEAKGWTVLR